MGLGGVYLSHYQRHPGQLAGLLLILVCAAMLWSGVHSLTDRASAAIEQSAVALEPRLAVTRRDARPLDVQDFAVLRRAGFCVTPRLRVRLGSGTGTAPLELLGIDPLTAGCLRQHPREAPVISALEATQQPRLWGNAAALSHWQQQAPVQDNPHVLSEMAQLPENLLLGDIATIDALREAGHSTLELLMPAPLPFALPREFSAFVYDYGVSSDSLARSFLLSLEALGWLGLLVATLLMRAVYLFAMEQRRRSLEILHRQGVEVWRLRLYLLVEMLLFCLLGSILGVWLGNGLAALLADGFRGSLSGLFSIDALGAGQPVWWLWLRAVLVLLALVIWACIDMLLFRGGGFATAAANVPDGMRRWLAGAVLVQAGVLGLWLGTQLWLIFAAAAVCLLGAGLVLPSLLGYLLVQLQKHSRSPMLEWSCSEMQALCALLRLPLLALAFAIASAIGIQAMVTGFETTFVRWLEQRLQGDLYLDPGRPVPLSDWVGPLEQLPSVSAVLPMVRGRALVEQQVVDVLGVDTASDLLAGWRFLSAAPKPWLALQHQGILVNEQLARRQQLKPGDWISVQFGSQQQLRRVAGIYADYGRPDAEVLVAANSLPQGLPQRYTTFVLGFEAGARPDWAQWPQAFPWLAGSRMRDQATIMAGANAAFARTFSITRALSGLTLVLSGVALTLMGLTLFRLRQRLYTLLYVFGITRASLRLRLCVHAMLITGLLGILATPLGVFLAWVLVARVNPIAFGWSLPFNLYPGYWLQVWLVCLAVGAVTGLMMTSPVRLQTLKNE